jgi:multiple sugar transport system substrate-binding protein
MEIHSLALLNLMRERNANLNIDIGALPAADGYTGKRGLPYASWGIGISNNSTHKEEAWKLISYLVSPEANAKLVTIAHAFPGNVNAKPDMSKADPLFVKAFEIFQNGKLANEFIGLPVAEQLQRDMDVELQKMISGQQTPAQAAAATQKQWLVEFAKN